jgi:hypothetical protein
MLVTGCPSWITHKLTLQPASETLEQLSSKRGRARSCCLGTGAVANTDAGTRVIKSVVGLLAQGIMVEFETLASIRAEANRAAKIVAIEPHADWYICVADSARRDKHQSQRRRLFAAARRMSRSREGEERAAGNIAIHTGHVNVRVEVKMDY